MSDLSMLPAWKSCIIFGAEGCKADCHLESNWLNCSNPLKFTYMWEWLHLKIYMTPVAYPFNDLFLYSSVPCQIYVNNGNWWVCWVKWLWDLLLLNYRRNTGFLRWGMRKLFRKNILITVTHIPFIPVKRLHFFQQVIFNKSISGNAPAFWLCIKELLKPHELLRASISAPL